MLLQAYPGLYAHYWDALGQMARKIRHSRFETRTSRLRLTIKPKPHTGPALADGVILLYRRRNQANGTWVLKAAVGDGQNRSYWTKRIGEADDYDQADGEKVLSFFQAQEKARQLTRCGAPAAGAPITVDEALKVYETDVQARGANVYNAQMPRSHLTPALLAKPVALLDSSELETWRNGLLGKVKPATVNRIANALKAALERVARHDRWIQSSNAWKIGLRGLPGRAEARNIVLPEDTVRAFVAAAYARDEALGLLVETLAVTGARPSQVIRLRVEDLRDDRLMMPKSGKGGGPNRSEKKIERFSVPITPALAMRLKSAAADRAPGGPCSCERTASLGVPIRRGITPPLSAGSSSKASAGTLPS